MVQFPVKISDISKFEPLNDISENGIGLKKSFNDGRPAYSIVEPLYLTENIRGTHVNLLFLSDDNRKSHYCLITKSSSFSFKPNVAT